MTDPVEPRRSRWRGRLLYLATILLTAAATYAVVALLMNINERKQEAKQHYLQIVELNEDSIDPAEWGKNFPREYDGWQKASHHAVATCNDCHVPHETIPKYLVKAENGFWHSKGFTLQDFPEPIRLRPVSLKVLQVNCVSCHRDLTNDILGRGSTGSETTDCVHCHAAVGHGPQR